MEQAHKVGGSQCRVVCELEKQTRTAVGEMVYGSLFVFEIVNLTTALSELHFGRPRIYSISVMERARKVGGSQEQGQCFASSHNTDLVW